MTILLTIALCAAAAPADAPQDWTTPFRFGGCGGAYFLAASGELWVDVEKADLNRSGRKTYLRAILFGPDRRVLDDQWIPDDGKEKGSGAGPVQRVRLATTVKRPGIYGLNVTVTEDRYGDDIAWGFRTNCAHYLIETSRGHRDAPHEEPLVLQDPDAPGDVCFLPKPGEFSVEVKNVSKGIESLTMYNAKGTEIVKIPVSPDGVGSCTVPETVGRDAVPWRLHLDKFQGIVQIDGVTRWPGNANRLTHLSLWTPQLESWFDFPEHRWPLTPYSRTVYAEPGAEGTVAFEVHNSASTSQTLALALEFPNDKPWPAELSASEIAMEPGKGVPVSVHYHVPAEGDSWTCYIRATYKDDSGISTYSTLELRRGIAPASKPLAMPLVLKPYNHENEQFGYLSDYPLANEMHFDMRNRPVVSDDDGIFVQHGDAWTKVSTATLPDGKSASFHPRLSKVAFDRDNNLYSIAIKGDSNHLLQGAAYAVTEGISNKWLLSPFIPFIGGGSFDIEQFTGHNVPNGPPPFVRIKRTAKDPKLMWRQLCDLDLFVPSKGEDGGAEGGAIIIGEPIPISKKCLGISMHSGAPSSIVSRGSKVHVAWGEATEPEEKVPGVPTFVATYDRETKTLSRPALVGYGPPANDVHNTPCITMDSQGYLHVLVGTHGNTFKYARSLHPNDSTSGWTEPEDIGSNLRQTYIGLVCDKNDTLHAVFRLWQNDTAYFPASHYACLAYMSKRPSEPWSEPRPLVIAPFSEYSVYYHRLTIDRAGRLFLSYDYWSTFWFYRTDHWGSRRALMMSPDSGQTWKLVSDDDLRTGQSN